MKRTWRTSAAVRAGLGLFLLAAAIAIGGCVLSLPKATKTLGAADRPQPAAAGQAQKGGAQLWAENCMRCHNMRSPESYSDAEWNVAMHHMRVRANLTEADYKAILQFLKAAN